MDIRVHSPTSFDEYELIDSGDGAKFERFGTYTMVRPDPRAIWKKTLPNETWQEADASFFRTDAKRGTWDIKKVPPTPWHIHYKSLTFTLRPTEFKHVGIFPEQAVNWDWLSQVISEKTPRVLNLFAYTGGSTMTAIANGATVTHVDAAKSTLQWAKENLQESHLDETKIRWIEDDAYKFVLREAKRQQTYDGIILDPPRFGRGSKGEVWKLEQHLPPLLWALRSILSPTPLFILINAYTSDLSSIVLERLLEQLIPHAKGVIDSGELTLKETASGKLLPNGIFARWSNQ